MGILRMTAGLCILASIAGGAQVRANPIFESYESGFGDWSPQSFLAVPDPTWQWSVTSSNSRASHGQWSLEMSASGVHDDGTIWVERSLELPAGEWEVRLEFDLWSPADADIGTWEKVAFIGTFDPEEESHFTVLGLEDVGGWKTYSLSKIMSFAQATPVWFAFGLNVVFETTRTHSLDSVTIRWSEANPVRATTWQSIKHLYR